MPMPHRLASPASRRLRYAAGVIWVTGSEALGQTLALLATFIGIGILVNVVIFYIVALVVGERKQNRERKASH